MRQVEALVLARLQVIAAGEEDAVVFGQLDAAATDGVDALHALRAGVEHQVPHCRFAVGAYAQQDQEAELRVGHVGIGE